tara:strand:- start:3178 stop:3951 length:774 start_codon:yes stop_codon:yes gene_type:complete
MTDSMTRNDVASLEGKVAIVTGGARNIGRAIVERLATAGASVMINFGPGTQDQAQELASTLAQEGRSVGIIAGDLSDPETAGAIFDRTMEMWGRADILVNNGAITGPRAKISQLSTAHFDEIFAVNARGVFLMMQQAMAKLSDNGRIVSIASSTTLYPQPDLGVYAASKAAVKALSEAFALEAGQRGITVNTVMPGPVVPGIFDAAPPERQKAIQQASPFGRLGTPADIADIVAFLASEESRWITGQHILANGGSQR